MGLPLPTLTRTIGSLGPLKEDVDAAPDDIHYPKAAEWNTAMDAIKSNRDELNALGMAGASGTLQQAYNNGMAAPTVIQLQGGKGRVTFRDTLAGLGTLLLSVADSTGTGEFGLAVDGFQLPNSAKGLYTAAGVAIRTRSGASQLTTAAYSHDTETAYDGTGALLAEWRSVGARAIGFNGGATPGVGFYNAGAFLCALSADTGTLRPQGAAGVAIDFRPSATPGNLGTSGEMWASAHANFFRGKSVTVPFNAALTIDASLGEWFEVTLSDSLVSLAVGNFGSGRIIGIKFIQDGVGGRTLTPAGVIPAIKLARDVPFTLSPAAGAVDVLWLYSDGLTYHEVARKQQRPPEFRVGSLTVAGGTQTITPHIDAHNWVYDGILNAVAVINLSRTNAKEGDRIYLEFAEGSGLTTDAVNTLTIQENGAGALKVYNEAKTLRGQVSAVYSGSAWRLNIGGCLSYA